MEPSINHDSNTIMELDMVREQIRAIFINKRIPMYDLTKLTPDELKEFNQLQQVENSLHEVMHTQIISKHWPL